MPMSVNELTPLQDKIVEFLNRKNHLAYSSKEIASYLEIAHSTARKHLKILFNRGTLKRGKQKNYNKTFFYHVG